MLDLDEDAIAVTVLGRYQTDEKDFHFTRIWSSNSIDTQESKLRAFLLWVWPRDLLNLNNIISLLLFFDS